MARFMLVLILFTLQDFLYSGDADVLSADKNINAVLSGNSYFIMAADLETGKEILVDGTPGMLESLFYPGSILKIFTCGAAFSRSSFDILCETECRRRDEQNPRYNDCWYGSGHGRVSFVRAFALSCNAYFIDAFQKLEFQAFIDFMDNCGLMPYLERRPLNRQEELLAMIGRMHLLRFSPRLFFSALNRFYLNTGGSFRTDVHEALMSGMRGCYQYGTAAEARRALFLAPEADINCKTGTGVYSAPPGIDLGRTSGTFTALVNGRYSVMVHVSGTTGGDTAARAGMMICSRILAE